MRIAILAVVSFGVLGVIGARCGAAEPPEPPAIAGLSFLVGEWSASGAGQPGQSTGEFTFEWAADRHALLRTNEAETEGGRHEDVMLVFSDAGGALRAVYVDGEGHTIHYDVTVDSVGRHVVFESTDPGPRFRLWYRLDENGELATGFEVAPPGGSEFKTYLEGVARRREE